jgi:hypothetical protein
MRLDPAERIAVLTLNTEFNDEIEKVRGKFGIDLDNKKTDRELENQVNDSHFQKDIFLICKKFSFQEKYWDRLATFVINDEYHWEQPEPAMVVSWDGGTYIQVDEDTTLKSVEQAFYDIQLRYGTANKKQKQYKTFWRDFLICSMAQRGSSVSEIWHSVEETYGEDLDFKQIRKIESKFRTKFKTSRNGRMLIEPKLSPL